MRDWENAVLEVGRFLDNEDASDLTTRPLERDEFAALWAWAMDLD